MQTITANLHFIHWRLRALAAQTSARYWEARCKRAERLLNQGTR